jgi:hypothetical protein
VHFYARNPARRGLDIDDHPDDKTDFVKFAAKLRCLDPIVDTKKSPLPPLKDLTEAVEAVMRVGLKPDKEPRREVEKTFACRGDHTLVVP